MHLFPFKHLVKLKLYLSNLFAYFQRYLFYSYTSLNESAVCKNQTMMKWLLCAIYR